MAANLGGTAGAALVQMPSAAPHQHN